MKHGWRESTIGEECTVINGGTPKTDVAAYWDGDFQWITPAEMGKRETPLIAITRRTITEAGIKDSSATPLPPYSVILSSRAPIGHLVINTVPMATNQGCKGLIPNRDISYKYLYYYLFSIVDLLNDLGTGTTFKELSGGKLKEVPFPIAPFKEQERIVAILDEATKDLSQLASNTDQKIERYYSLYFSRLGECVKGLWNSTNLVKLSDLASDIVDGDHMPPPKASSGVPFITISNVNKQSHQIDLSETFFVPRTYFDGLKENRRPRVGDLLYTVTGSFGIPVKIESNVEFCFQRHIALIRPKADVSTSWLYHLVRSPQLIRQSESAATGTAQKTVSLSALRAFRVPAISYPQQKALAAELDELLSATARLESAQRKKLAEINALKQSLLHQAFSGNL